MKPRQSVSGDQLDAYWWIPDGEIAGVVQLVHGMAEHMARYDHLAETLRKASFAVVGHTHLGHSENDAVKGFFGKRNGVKTLLADMHALRTDAQAAYPGVPYFMVGHSMGSFLMRLYMREHGEGLQGVVLSGTGYFEEPLARLGLGLATLPIMVGAGMKPAQLINKVAFGGNNKRFLPARTEFDWLSTDTEQVDLYVADALCGYPFTAYGYRDLFRMLLRLCDEKEIAHIPQTLPVYLMAGADDPVGQLGAGVTRVASQLKQAGLTDVEISLYKDARHEIFNETDREQIYRELIRWLLNHLA